jgi:hypothetical protein
MKPDPIFKNHGSSIDPQFLAELVDMEDEGKACPVLAAEQLLEERRFEKVMRMTAQAFGRLSPVEKRNYARWAKHLAKVFGEKASLFERNSRPEPELPDPLRAQG